MTKAGLASATVRRRGQLKKIEIMKKKKKPMEKEDDNNNNDDDEDDEDNKDNEDEEEEFFFAKILKMTKYTSLPNLVRLAQWEQVSDDIRLHTTTTG